MKSSHQKAKFQLRVRPCVSLGSWCLPESVRGEACACKNSREGGVQTSVVLASTVLLGCQKLGNCTLGQLMSPRSESVFFASFLCRFGQRNDGRIQLVVATPITSASLSAGVIKSRVLRGLPFRSAATLFNSACE